MAKQRSSLRAISSLSLGYSSYRPSCQPGPGQACCRQRAWAACVAWCLAHGTSCLLCSGLQPWAEWGHRHCSGAALHLEPNSAQPTWTCHSSRSTPCQRHAGSSAAAGLCPQSAGSSRSALHGKGPAGGGPSREHPHALPRLPPGPPDHPPSSWDHRPSCHPLRHTLVTRGCLFHR